MRNNNFKTTSGTTIFKQLAAGLCNHRTSVQYISQYSQSCSARPGCVITGPAPVLVYFTVLTELVRAAGMRSVKGQCMGEEDNRMAQPQHVFIFFPLAAYSSILQAFTHILTSFTRILPAFYEHLQAFTIILQASCCILRAFTMHFTTI